MRLLDLIGPNYKEKCKAIDYFHRDSAGLELETGKKVPLEELIDRAKRSIKECGLSICPENESRVTIVAFTLYPDKEGYNVCGVLFFVGKSKYINFSVTYFGICGDVNTVDITSGKYVKFYCK